MICTNCGSEVPDTANVCGNCGHRLKSGGPGGAPGFPAPAVLPTNQPVSTPPRRGLPVWVWGLLAGTLVLAALGAVLILFSPSLSRIFKNLPAQAANTTSQPAVPAAPTNTPSDPATKTLPDRPSETPSATPDNPNDKSLEHYFIPGRVQELLPEGQVTGEGAFITDYLEPSNLPWFYSTKGIGYDQFDLNKGLKLTGAGENITPSTWVASKFRLGEGQAIWFTFKTHAAPYIFHTYLYSGQGGTPSDRIVGIASQFFPSLDPLVFSGGVQKAQGAWPAKLFSLEPDGFYEILFGVGYNGNFIQAVWKYGQEEDAFYNVYNLEEESSWSGGGWDDREWNIFFKADTSEFDLIYYYLISFEK